MLCILNLLTYLKQEWIHFAVTRIYFMITLSKFPDTFHIKCVQFCWDAFRFGTFIVHYLGGYFFPDRV